MSSACCWKYSLLDLAFKWQCSSWGYYKRQREDIHVLVTYNTLNLPWLCKVFNIQLCSLHLLLVWKRIGNITNKNWYTITTASTTSAAILTTCAITSASNIYAATSNTYIKIAAYIYFWFVIMVIIVIGWCSGGIPQVEPE